MAVKVTYSEPVDYIPKEVRKKLGLGEFNTDTATPDSKASKPAPKSSGKKSK